MKIGTSGNKILPLLIVWFFGYIFASFGYANADEKSETDSEASSGEIPNAADKALELTQLLLKKIHESSNNDDDNSDEEIRSLIAEIMDTRRFVRGVMGKHYSSATKDQVKKFHQKFEKSLNSTYIKALRLIDPNLISLQKKQPPQKDSRKAKVLFNAKFKSGDVYPFSYTLSYSESNPFGWILLNLSLNGINIGKTYRAEFYSRMEDPRNNGEIDKVIESWSNAGIGSSQKKLKS